MKIPIKSDPESADLHQNAHFFRLASKLVLLVSAWLTYLEWRLREKKKNQTGRLSGAQRFRDEKAIIVILFINSLAPSDGDDGYLINIYWFSIIFGQPGVRVNRFVIGIHFPVFRDAEKARRRPLHVGLMTEHRVYCTAMGRRVHVCVRHTVLVI